MRIICLCLFITITTVHLSFGKTSYVREALKLELSIYDNQVNTVDPIIATVKVINLKREKRIIYNPEYPSLIVQYRATNSKEWESAPFFSPNKENIDVLHLSGYPVIKLDKKDTMEVVRAILPCHFKEQISKGRYEVRVIFYSFQEKEPIISNIEHIEVNNNKSVEAKNYLQKLKYPCFLYYPDVYSIYLNKNSPFDAKNHLNYLIKNQADTEYSVWARIFFAYVDIYQNTEIVKFNLKEFLESENPFIREEALILKNELELRKKLRGIEPDEN